MLVPDFAPADADGSGRELLPCRYRGVIARKDEPPPGSRIPMSSSNQRWLGGGIINLVVGMHPSDGKGLEH
jgi:hypothetical protein